MQKFLVLGASGLIGQAVAADLMQRGLSVTAVARRLPTAQRALFGDEACETPIADLDAQQMVRLVADSGADIVVNALGLLQDRPGQSTQNVHDVFVARLIAALRQIAKPVLLIHISIPGDPKDDSTPFAITKRRADRLIEESGLPYVILRPGFVIAPAPYGGSAMLRALAALPIDLPDDLASRPLRFVAVEDIAQTIAILSEQWRGGTPSTASMAAVLDLMHPEQHTMASLLSQLRRWLGDIWPWHVRLPGWMIDIGAKAGDLSAYLGWSPPMRSTAIAELRRGVDGDPQPWLALTGLTPRSLDSVLRARPATIENRWFARLYLFKALIVVTLAVFWFLSGLIALTVSYREAVDLMMRFGFSPGLSQAFTIVSSLTDMMIGALIALRRTHRPGLIAGIVVAVGYMLGCAVLTPALWLEPLGSLVKTGPAIVLMIVALAISDER